MRLFFSGCIFFILMLTFSCKVSSIESVSPKDYSKKYAVGKGGGFTESYQEYILYENGKVYKQDFSYNREIFVKKLSEEDLNHFLAKINTLGLEGIEINEPGNMVSYIDVREGNYSINKIIWGANLYYPPKEIVTFHKELFDKLSEQE